MNILSLRPDFIDVRECLCNSDLCGAYTRPCHVTLFLPLTFLALRGDYWVHAAMNR